MWLTILDNETVLLIAETLFIIIGSMLLGILLSYFYWGGSRTQARELTQTLEAERQQRDNLLEQIHQLDDTRMRLQHELLDLRLRNDQQSKVIYDHQQYIYSIEKDHERQRATNETLQAEVENYKQRIHILQTELETPKRKESKAVLSASLPVVRANYEHVSHLLGRQVTENDLTLITGIGPKTASLLQSRGISTWEHLAETPQKELRQILEDAGGIYRAQDPTHWSKQARMAAKGEWRKLRLFQENLKKMD